MNNDDIEYILKLVHEGKLYASIGKNSANNMEQVIFKTLYDKLCDIYSYADSKLVWTDTSLKE